MSNKYKNYDNLEKAKKDGVDMWMKCRCNECGEIFYTKWRSKYSPAPVCDLCGDPLFVKVLEVGRR